MPGLCLSLDSDSPSPEEKYTMNDPANNQNLNENPIPIQEPIQIEVDHFLENWKAYETKHSENACILFADLVGSTEFKRDHPVIEGLGKTVLHNRLAENAIVQHYGNAVKYLGDGVMGIFRGPDCGRNAISAGLDLILGIDQENKKRGLGFPRDLNTKVGVHHGPHLALQVSSGDCRRPTRLDGRSGISLLQHCRT